MKSAIKKGLQLIFLLLFMFVSVSRVCPGKEIASPRLMVTAGGNLFSGSSGDYRQIYGKSVFMPEIKVTGLIFRNFTAWGSLGFISKNGYIEEVAEPSKIQQTMFGIGIGYAHKLSAVLRLRGELGLAFISFQEQAMEETANGSGMGWKIGVNLDYFIGKKLFVTLTAAYSAAGDEAETGRIKLGGFQAGVGLGFAF
jgi:hypothetical protein